MALGTLARYGPRHGHEIRRLAEISNLSQWGGVSVGALYRDLRTMEAEGLVEAVRTEQVGRRPARTIYSITAAGQMELAMLRVQAIRAISWGPDALGVALSFAVAGMDRRELAHLLASRREACAAAARELAATRELKLAQGYIDALTAEVIRRGQLNLETEVRWLGDLAEIIRDLPETQDIT